MSTRQARKRFASKNKSFQSVVFSKRSQHSYYQSMLSDVPQVCRSSCSSPPAINKDTSSITSSSNCVNSDATVGFDKFPLFVDHYHFSGKELKKSSYKLNHTLDKNVVSQYHAIRKQQSQPPREVTFLLSNRHRNQSPRAYRSSVQPTSQDSSMSHGLVISSVENQSALDNYENTMQEMKENELKTLTTVPPVMSPFHSIGPTSSASYSYSISAHMIPLQPQDAVRIPVEIISEMFSNASKNARLRTEFMRKCDTLQYMMGIPWLESKTQSWIRLVLFLQFLSWMFSVLSTTSSAISDCIPPFIPAVLAPFFTLHHFLGYLSFARRSAFLATIYCVIVVVTGSMQGLQFACSVRELTVLKQDTATVIVSALVVELVSSLLGIIADLSLFFASGTLFLRIRHEESEMRVLIPIETLEETPNDLPFLRWYFSLPRVTSCVRETGSYYGTYASHSNQCHADFYKESDHELDKNSIR